MVCNYCRYICTNNQVCHKLSKRTQEVIPNCNKRCSREVSSSLWLCAVHHSKRDQGLRQTRMHINRKVVSWSHWSIDTQDLFWARAKICLTFERWLTTRVLPVPTKFPSNMEREVTGYSEKPKLNKFQQIIIRTDVAVLGYTEGHIRHASLSHYDVF